MIASYFKRAVLKTKPVQSRDMGQGIMTGSNTVALHLLIVCSTIFKNVWHQTTDGHQEHPHPLRRSLKMVALFGGFVFFSTGKEPILCKLIPWVQSAHSIYKYKSGNLAHAAQYCIVWSTEPHLKQMWMKQALQVSKVPRDLKHILNIQRFLKH